MRRLLIAAIVLWIGGVGTLESGRDRGPAFFGAATALAQEDWRKEFEEVCSKTQDAMVIPSGELRKLVERCDKLKPRIEQLEESQRKVYRKRLQLCRDLYLFVLETRENKP